MLQDDFSVVLLENASVLRFVSEAENARIEGRVTNDRRQNCRHIDFFQPFYYFSFISFARVKLTYSPLSSPTPNKNDVVLPCIVIL